MELAVSVPESHESGFHSGHVAKISQPERVECPGQKEAQHSDGNNVNGSSHRAVAAQEPRLESWLYWDMRPSAYPGPGLLSVVRT